MTITDEQLKNWRALAEVKANTPPNVLAAADWHRMRDSAAAIDALLDEVSRLRGEVERGVEARTDIVQRWMLSALPEREVDARAVRMENERDRLVCGRAAPFGCCTRRKDAAPLKGESPIWSVLFKVHECVSRDYLPGSKLRTEIRAALNRCPKCGFGLSIDGRGSWLCQRCGAAHLRDDEDDSPSPRVAAPVVDGPPDTRAVEARVVEEIAAWLRQVISEHRHPTSPAYCYVDTEILEERLRAGAWRNPTEPEKEGR